MIKKIFQKLSPPIFLTKETGGITLKTLINQFAFQIIPPIIVDGLASLKGQGSERKLSHLLLRADSNQDPINQDLEVYWNPRMADQLETWGEGTVWNELEFMMVNCQGRVLDIACGTGKNIEALSKFTKLEVHGCDISDLFIQRAITRGIPKEYLKVCDATQTNYKDNYFNYSYSIGSLEHFTQEGIIKFISEAYRITNCSSLHMVPVSRSKKNEGWIKRFQSYYNNSENWWLKQFQSYYKTVFVLDSSWQDSTSVGKWFVCVKDQGENNESNLSVM